MQYTKTYRSPIGDMIMASNGESLTGLWFGTISLAHKKENLPVFAQTNDWLDCYFGGAIPDFMPPLLLEGTCFRLAVWQILQQIPYGQVITYGEIAGMIARQKGIERMSAQAIGGAVGHNPLAILVPCHRVIGRNGNLTGYAGGLDKKVQLLTLEKVDMTHFFLPKQKTE